MDGPGGDQGHGDPRNRRLKGGRSPSWAELCCDALNMALNRRGPVPGLILHSDRGRQYASGDYRKIIHRAKLRQSMSRKGQCLRNS